MYKTLPRRLIGFVLVFLALFWLAVSGAAGDSGTAGSQRGLPLADAAQLWRYITVDQDYRKWKNFPNQETLYLHVSENPHGDWVGVFLNSEAYDSVTNPSSPFEMKYGSILVKENYSLLRGDPINKPPLNAVPVAITGVTVMYKIKGYQRVPGEEEWFWVMYGCPAGKCDGSVVTISNQQFVNEPIPQSRDTFTFFQGEVATGKPWICVGCHQRANISNDFSYGDHVWKVKAFSPH